MFDRLLKLSRRDNSNKWSIIEFDEEVGIIEKEIHILYRALRNVSLIIETYLDS